jgi:hypothetical protein
MYKIGDSLIYTGLHNMEFTFGKRYRVYSVDHEYMVFIDDRGVENSFATSIVNEYFTADEPIRVAAAKYDANTETFALLEKGSRNNTGKPQLSYNLLGAEVQAGEAAVWQFGADKYARGNWLKGREYTDCANSLLRHLTDFLSGADNDIETGLPHVDHIVCCAKILSNAFHTRKDLDDRK